MRGVKGTEGGEHGVYLLFRKKRLVYVGRSQDPESRIKTHRRNGRQFDYALQVAVPADDVAWVEAALIEAMNPPQNSRGVTVARVEPPDEIVRVVVKEAAPYVLPPPDPNRTFAVTSPPIEVSNYGLTAAYKDAVKSGDLHSFPAHPDRAGPGRRRLITRGEFDRWVAAKMEERRGWRDLKQA